MAGSGEWRARFRLFWAGETVSLLGSEITVLALPLVALLTLHASAAQVGVLGMARFAPMWVLGLPVGAWVDSRTRRPLLIAANLGRAGLLVAIPVLVAVGRLSFMLLVVVALGVGALGVIYETAYPAYVPALVPPGELVGANSRLVASASAAEVGGPGLGGLLVGMVGAPLALLADAGSYLVAAGTVAGARAVEVVPASRARLWPRIRQGLALTFGDAYLRAICLEAGTYNAWEGALLITFLFYGIREVGLSAQLVGVVLSIGAAGAVLGSILAPAAVLWLGFGRALISAMVVGCLAPVLLPLAPSSPTPVAVLGAAGLFVSGVGIAASSVHVITLRQRLFSGDMMGRATAGYKLVSYGGIPLGSLLGGLLTGTLGGRSALLVIAVGLLVTPLWVLCSPVRHLRALPDQPVRSLKPELPAAQVLP